MTCRLCRYPTNLCTFQSETIPFPELAHGATYQPAGTTPASSSPQENQVSETTFEVAFAELYGTAFDLLIERQRKYGPENIRQLGLFGVFGRLADDKIERIRRGMNGRVEHGKVFIEDFTDFGDESFEDALLDIANYALIMLALKRGVWGKPLEKAKGSTLRLCGVPPEVDLSDVPPQDPLGHYVSLPLDNTDHDPDCKAGGWPHEGGCHP